MDPEWILNGSMCASLSWCPHDIVWLTVCCGHAPRAVCWRQVGAVGRAGASACGSDSDLGSSVSTEHCAAESGVIGHRITVIASRSSPTSGGIATEISEIRQAGLSRVMHALPLAIHQTLSYTKFTKVPWFHATYCRTIRNYVTRVSVTVKYSRSQHPHVVGVTTIHRPHTTHRTV